MTPPFRSCKPDSVCTAPAAAVRCASSLQIPPIELFALCQHRVVLTCADRTAYAVHPLPLSDVQALRKAVPSFGTHHVVVVLGNGLTLPPLFFGQGGVRAMFSALKQVEPPWVFLSI